MPSPTPGATGPFTGGGLSDVSCPESNFCMAVGRYNTKEGGQDYPLFESWDGSQWTAVPGAPRREEDGELALDAISCSGPDFCMAVGSYEQTHLVSETWNGSGWSFVAGSDPSTSFISAGLNSVSCTSARSCVAVGNVLGEGGPGDKALVESWSGATWSIVPNPDPGPYTVLSSVSCTTSGGTLCIAVGGYGAASVGITHALAEISTGGGWSVSATVHRDAAASSSFATVSCSSATQCAALGTYRINGSNFLLDDNWDGSWALVEHMPEAVPQFVSVSCLETANCVATTSSGIIWGWDGSAWSEMSAPNGTGAPIVFAVSCAPGFCVAVGTRSGVSAGEELTWVEQGCDDVTTGPSSGEASSAEGEPASSPGAVPSRLSFAAPAPAPAPATTAGCPLEVTVRALEPLRAGLAVHASPWGQYPPVDFAAGGDGKNRCESGCVDLVVTVTNPRTQKPVEGALVSAHVSDLVPTREVMPTAIVKGDQYLCSTGSDGTKDVDCGTSVSNKYDDYLHTNRLGQVFLRYWAPGVTEHVHTTLSIVARVECTSRSCPSHEMTGTTKTTLAVSPYLIYAHTSTLTSDQVAELEAWAGGGALFKRFLTGTSRAALAAKAVLKWLKAKELASATEVKALEAVEHAEPLVLVSDIANYLSDAGERFTMIAEFLYVTDLDGIGLGRAPFESSAPTSLALDFENKVVNYGVALPFEAFAAGAWWDIAHEVAAADDAHGGIFVGGHRVPKVDKSDWGVKLDVYEVSNCDPSPHLCQPGYYASGMDPELYFFVVLTYNGEPYNFADFTVPYDAVAWTETQWDLRGLIKGGPR
ncbi:MAG TPA: hypothetical protein VME46_12305 [Acidimicrobiales bacterium]|nr:hypothetical protein [Acidimicrobiales bacterium]